MIALGLDHFSQYFVDEKHNYTWTGGTVDLLANMLWILALGGLGTCGYLGTSLMSESRRIMARISSLPNTALPNTAGMDGSATPIVSEIDLTDANLITTRVVIGILFSFILCLPAYKGNLHAIIMGATGGASDDVSNPQNLAKDFALTLLPFILGFSTTLVLTVMERFVTAIGSLFGITPSR